jgi:putative restriction endonuclease
MALADISSREAVLVAIAEFDRLGRERFLKKYGFGQARTYWLVHQGKRYDSKAIVGAAHGHARPGLGSLKAADFVGGEATVRRKLEELGFAVEVDGKAEPDAGRELTSERLTPNAIYTRDDLKALFGVADATINTGVFRPKGTSSVWLFITEEKTSDRTQYRDRLDGDTLHWQGQTSGRTDGLIIGHQARGLELLVFFRKRKYEHPGAGFRYVGRFAYVSHQGGGPTSFVLCRQADDSPLILPGEADEERFDPAGVEDARERTMRAIAQRRGQKAFRDALIAAYEGKCVITGCAVLDVLEAAHIYPYRGPETNKVTNGLLLRADLHTLFDCGLVAIDADALTVIAAPRLRRTDYAALHGVRLREPQSLAQRPSREALALHREAARL